jgi:hypothetical protein
MDINQENILKYVLDIFKSNYPDCDPYEIDYGLEKNARVCIKNTSGNYFLERIKLDDTKIVWKDFYGQKIPFLFSGPVKEEIMTVTENKTVINFDIIASAFYFLSCWQEFTTDKKDLYGRYRYEDSLQKKLGITKIPVVNYYFEILKQAIEQSCHIKLIRKAYPGNAGFAVCLTHDIDSCNSGWKEDLYWALKKGELKSVFRIIRDKLSGMDSWFTFDTIIQAEKNVNATSSFYFLAKKGRCGNIPNSDYNLQSEKIQHVIKLVEQEGSEAAIHGSYRTHDDEESFHNEYALFKNKVLGNRFHYLEFDIEKSPEVLQKNGVKYDTTLGFAESIGFRNSYCHPYYLYDFKNACRSEVMEIPLMIMDTTLRKYCKIDQQELVNVLDPVISEVEKFNGVLTVLWHNTSFSDYKYRGWSKIYSDILSHLQTKNAWLTKASGIYFFNK